MHLNRKGVTRLVIVFRNVVIKVPNFTCQWSHFLQGLLSNIRESRTWKACNSENKHLLCPVLWASFGGWILIMKRVDKCLEYDDYDKYDISAHRRHFEGDDTISNYGLIGNRLVKIDYGQVNTLL